LKFSELFAEATSRPEVICTFLALLELMRLKQLVCLQPEAFGEIEIGRVPGSSGIPGALASHITDSIALAGNIPPVPSHNPPPSPHGT
jgi:hypothetical protein